MPGGLKGPALGRKAPGGPSGPGALRRLKWPQAGRGTPRWMREPPAALAAASAMGLAVAALAAPWLAPYDPYLADLPARLQPPSPLHPMGTDHLGRDVLSRVLYGARVSLGIGVASRLISAALGLVLGSAAGFVGGWVDAAIMRLAEVVLAIPDLLLALAVVFVLGPGLPKLFVALSVVGWAGLARVVRAQVLALRELPFVEAARAAGAGPVRILVRHVLPNCLAPVMVFVSVGIPSTILAEAGLSFLGLGVEPPVPSWGQMVAAGRPFLRVAPWLVLYPGLAILLTVLTFNVLGDALRDALDPRWRR